MPDGPSKEEAKKIQSEVNKTTDENAGDLKGAMGGGCSPELTKQATGTMVAVVNVVDKVNKVLSSSNIGGLFSDDSLKKIYENTKKTNDNALLNEYIAEKNYMINKYGSGPDNLSKGSTEYNDLLSKRYRAQGYKDLEDLNSKYVEVNNLIMDLIQVTQQQNIAVENMKKVMEDLDEKNKELLNIINGGKSDLYTYNRLLDLGYSVGMYCDVIFKKRNIYIGSYSYRFNIISIFFDSSIFMDIGKDSVSMEFHIYGCS
jgi:methyl-accepting chemotaxis protein